jgi:hypothetical protein
MALLRLKCQLTVTHREPLSRGFRMGRRGYVQPDIGRVASPVSVPTYVTSDLGRARPVSVPTYSRRGVDTSDTGYGRCLQRLSAPRSGASCLLFSGLTSACGAGFPTYPPPSLHTTYFPVYIPGAARRSCRFSDPTDRVLSES